MKDRIKKLRKTLKLTQTEIANQISVRQSTYSNYETGRARPSNTAIDNICKTFSVNKVWLMTGVGEMFLSKTFAENNLDPKLQSIIDIFNGLPNLSQDILYNFAFFLEKYKDTGIL